MTESLISRAATFALTMFYPAGKFGPLTTGESPATETTVPVPSARPPFAPPKVEAGRAVDLRYGQRPSEPPGLVAHDCLFENGCPGGCVSGYGNPVRAGESCYTSRQLLRRSDLERAEPEYYRRAVELGLR